MSEFAGVAMSVAAAVTTAAGLEAAGAEGTFWYVAAGTLSGTIWRASFWIEKGGKLDKATARRDIASVFGLFGLAMFTAGYLGWTEWAAFAVAFAGSLIGIEPIRRAIMGAWDGWVASWRPRMPNNGDPK